MYGKATLDIPASRDIGRSVTGGLSDEVATVMGLTAAWTLPDGSDPVVVTLESGETRVIGPNLLRYEADMGRLL